MDLKSVISSVVGGKKASEVEKFLAVKISTSLVAATVWYVSEEKVEIGSVAMADINGSSWEVFLKAVDKAVSEATAGDETIKKVVFAVPVNYVREGKIDQEHLKDLRRLCKELDLSPQGYVDLTEALENYFKETEGAPLTAILIGIDKNQSVLSMCRAGKDLGSISLSSEGEITEAIEKALKHFEVEVLPSRIILYDGKSDLTGASDKITAYPWTTKLPFLHFPKVEILPADFVVKAVAAAGGASLGGEVETISGGVLVNSEQSIVNSHEETKDEERVEAVEEMKQSDEAKELEEVSAEEAGFVNEGMEELDIPVGRSEPIALEDEGGLAEMDSNLDEEEKSGRKLALPAFGAIFAGISKNMSGFLTRFKKTEEKALVSEAKKFGVPPVILVVIAVLILALVSLCLAVYFVPRANIVVSVVPKSFDHQMDITVATGEATDSATVNGEVVTVSEIGTRKGVATGQKLVGNKAKGTVTIYSVDGTKDFAAGTTLTAASGLKFTLDQDVSVASGDAVTPATVNAAVTAADIGTDYNLDSGTRFTIGGLPSSAYLAKNDSSFTGGSSHQATVVVKADQDRLMATLSAELGDKGKFDLSAKLGSNQTLLPNAMTSSVTKKKFSKDVGDEADTVSLDLSMDFSGVVFKKDDVVGLFANNYSGDVPEGYQLTPGNSQIEVLSAKMNKDGTATLKVHVTAKMLPKINGGEIAGEISGKSIKFATDLIEKIPGVSGVEISVNPKAFAPIVANFLPWQKSHIMIETITQ